MQGVVTDRSSCLLTVIIGPRPIITRQQPLAHVKSVVYEIVHHVDTKLSFADRHLFLAEGGAAAPSDSHLFLVCRQTPN